MRTGARVFGLSGLFGLALAGAYWIVAGEPAGTTLLTFMGAAALVIAAFLRGAGPPGLPEDRDAAAPGEPSDQAMVAFPRGSPWPAGVALGAILLGGGFVFGPWLLVVGGGVLAATLLGLARQSRS